MCRNNNKIDAAISPFREKNAIENHDFAIISPIINM